MFRVKRKSFKQECLNSILEMFEPENFNDKLMKEKIIDYLYDFYDGTKRHKFPEDKNQLRFDNQPYIESGFDGSRWITVYLSCNEPESIMYLSLNLDESFHTYIESNNQWESTPGLTHPHAFKRTDDV